MNIFKAKTSRKICFVHVPKCGGESIKSGISRAYNSNLKKVKIKAAASLKGSLILDPDCKHQLHQYREHLLRYFLCDRKVGLVMGHYPCRMETLETFDDEWNFVTILRNPVERFVSHFMYNRHKESTHFNQDQPLEDFLITDRAIALGEIYVRYFSHYPRVGNLEEGIEESKKSLDKFQCVGVLEDLGKWQAGFEKTFGGRLRIKKSNSSPAGAKNERQAISPEQMNRIAELCQPSMDVYNYVLSKK